jgi:hypothetical protein
MRNVYADEIQDHSPSPDSLDTTSSNENKPTSPLHVDTTLNPEQAQPVRTKAPRPTTLADPNPFAIFIPDTASTSADPEIRAMFETEPTVVKRHHSQDNSTPPLSRKPLEGEPDNPAGRTYRCTDMPMILHNEDCQCEIPMPVDLTTRTILTPKTKAMLSADAAYGSPDKIVSYATEGSPGGSLAPDGTPLEPGELAGYVDQRIKMQLEKRHDILSELQENVFSCYDDQNLKLTTLLEKQEEFEARESQRDLALACTIENTSKSTFSAWNNIQTLHAKMAVLESHLTAQTYNEEIRSNLYRHLYNNAARVESIEKLLKTERSQRLVDDKDLKTALLHKQRISVDQFSCTNLDYISFRDILIQKTTVSTPDAIPVPLRPQDDKHFNAAQAAAPDTHAT